MPITLLTFTLFVSLLLLSPTSSNTSCHHPHLPHHQLTVLISGYSTHRIPLLLRIAASYAASPSVAVVFILWCNPSTSPHTLSLLSHNLSLLYTSAAPITLQSLSSSSLNSRFLPLPSIPTRGVLVCDDDVDVDPPSLEFAFRVWRANQDRLIGLFPRSHDLDLTSKGWIYTVHPDRYSIVLTKFMILDVGYLYLYSCGGGAQWKENENYIYKIGQMRGVVDNMNNCEDILMNFLVADATGRGPILVGAERVRDWGDARNEVEVGVGMRKKEVGVGLSGINRGGGVHRKRRGECIREFHRILGRMPLSYSYGKVVNSIKDQGLCEKGGKLVPCDQQVV